MSVPGVPLAPHEVVATFGKHLSPFECSEILQFPAVYYFAAGVVKIQGSATRPSNCGYDRDGRYRCVLSDHIAYRYQILGELGQGTFGDVVAALDHKTQRKVAIKIGRSDEPRFVKQAEVESSILRFLNHQQAEGKQENVVAMLDQFVFRNHVCIVFEMLNRNLYFILEESGMKGLPTDLIRDVTAGLVCFLAKLHQAAMVHSDLKPENIMLTGETTNSIKVIDFGSCCYGPGPFYGVAQSRYYRAPEVILETGFSTPADMWSVGCILAELYTGKVLFPGRSEEEQLMLHMEALGMPSENMLDEGTRTDEFFDSDDHPLCLVDRKGRAHPVGSKTIAMLLGDDVDPALADFVARCVVMEPMNRMSALEAACHPFLAPPVTVEVTPPLTSTSLLVTPVPRDSAVGSQACGLSPASSGTSDSLAAKGAGPITSWV